MQMMMASMMERQQRAEDERDDRRAQQQQNQMMMAGAMMASLVGRAAPTAPSQSQNRDAGVGEDESWDLIGGAGAGKPKDDRDCD